MRKIRCKKCKGNVQMIEHNEYSKNGDLSYPIGSICLICNSVKINSQFKTDLVLEEQEQHWQEMSKK